MRIRSLHLLAPAMALAILIPAEALSQARGGAARGNAHAVGGDRTFQELHGVVDRQRRRHRAARAVDVHVDFLRAVFVLQEQQFLNRQIGEVVVDLRVAARFTGAAQEDDPVFHQQIVGGHLPHARVVAVALRLRHAGEGAHRRRIRETHGICLSGIESIGVIEL